MLIFPDYLYQFANRIYYTHITIKSHSRLHAPKPIPKNHFLVHSVVHSMFLLKSSRNEALMTLASNSQSIFGFVKCIPVVLLIKFFRVIACSYSLKISFTNKDAYMRLKSFSRNSPDAATYALLQYTPSYLNIKSGEKP